MHTKTIEQLLERIEQLSRLLRSSCSKEENIKLNRELRKVFQEYFVCLNSERNTSINNKDAVETCEIPRFKKGCKVENCKNKHAAKGYCAKHYYQIRKYGKIR